MATCGSGTGNSAAVNGYGVIVSITAIGFTTDNYIIFR